MQRKGGEIMMTFGQFLDREYGVDWTYFDNNYSAESANAVFAEYDEYVRHPEPYRGYEEA